MRPMRLPPWKRPRRSRNDHKLSTNASHTFKGGSWGHFRALLAMSIGATTSMSLLFSLIAEHPDIAASCFISYYNKQWRLNLSPFKRWLSIQEGESPNTIYSSIVATGVKCILPNIFIYWVQQRSQGSPWSGLSGTSCSIWVRASWS